MRNRRHAGGTLAGLLTVLLLVEAPVRMAFFDRLPIPQNDVTRKLGWLASQPGAHTLIVGDSTGYRGVDAAVFGSASNEPTLNASFQAGSPIVMARFVDAAPCVPKRIVVTLFPFNLSDSWPGEPSEIEAATARERVALMGAGDGLVSSAWATYRRRGCLRSIAAGFRPDRPVHRSARHDETGSLATVSESTPSAAEAGAWLTQWGGTAGGPVLGVRYRRLRLLAESWRDRGIDVVYVMMPIASDLRRLERADGSYEFQTAPLETVVKEFGGRLLDCREVLPDTAFCDADHLKAGPLRTAFSRALGAAVASGSTSVDAIR